MKRVVVFGVFDLLHPGHLYFLEQAKKCGDRLLNISRLSHTREYESIHLTVVVTRDARVKHEKKHKAIFSERERLAMVQALHMVDHAVLGDRVGEWKILKKLKPDVICVGYDQNAEWIKKCGLENMPRIVRIKGSNPKVYSSGGIAKQLLTIT